MWDHGLISTIIVSPRLDMPNSLPCDEFTRDYMQRVCQSAGGIQSYIPLPVRGQEEAFCTD